MKSLKKKRSIAIALLYFLICPLRFSHSDCQVYYSSVCTLRAQSLTDDNYSESIDCNTDCKRTVSLNAGQITQANCLIWTYKVPQELLASIDASVDLTGSLFGETASASVVKDVANESLKIWIRGVECIGNVAVGTAFILQVSGASESDMSLIQPGGDISILVITDF